MARNAADDAQDRSAGKLFIKAAIVSRSRGVPPSPRPLQNLSPAPFPCNKAATAIPSKLNARTFARSRLCHVVAPWPSRNVLCLPRDSVLMKFAPYSMHASETLQHHEKRACKKCHYVSKEVAEKHVPPVKSGHSVE
jgi:hypothetical protein